MMSMLRRFPLILVVLLLMGCFGREIPPVTVKHYAVEYPPPAREGRIAPDAVVRMERFTTGEGMIGRAMVFRPKLFVRETYRYHRWDVVPADMVQALLLRDIRHAGLFNAALSPHDGGTARYVINGHVAEFLEIDEGDRSYASVVLDVTVIDTAGAPDEVVLLQKTYRGFEPMPSRQPHALARSMSAAMARLSAAFLEDLGRAVKENKK